MTIIASLGLLRSGFELLEMHKARAHCSKLYILSDLPVIIGEHEF